MSAPARFDFDNKFARRPTREVKVGALGIGAHNPLRVQSMTTTDTRDVRATVAQITRLVEEGCELVRVTAPGLHEARALGEIRAALSARGLRVPLCADIHFTPNAALEAAKHVEKVRINPGNYADSKKFAVREYSDAEYAAELERVAARVRPLVRRCREHGRALRIGANHGSLSDRILNRFGDTPLGMVESALEFLEVCEDENFRDIIFSMKSSNPRVAIHAYRLLAARLEARAPGTPSYPFHLGVTEAGDGEDARIKSAIGIGALLEDGLGDTLRVSLTEDPVREIPVARALADRYNRRAVTSQSAARIARTPTGDGAQIKARTPTEDGAETKTCAVAEVATPSANVAYVDDRFSHTRRKTRALGALGAEQPVRVEALLGAVSADAAGAVREIARALDALGELVCEGLMVTVRDAAEVQRLANFARALAALPNAPPLAAFSTAELAPACAPHVARVAFEITGAAPVPHTADTPAEWVLGADTRAFTRALKHATPALASVACAPALHDVRANVEAFTPQTSAPHEARALDDAPALHDAHALGDARELGDARALHDSRAQKNRAGRDEFLSATHAVRELVALLRAQGHGAVPVALRHVYSAQPMQTRAQPPEMQRTVTPADADADAVTPTPAAAAVTHPSADADAALLRAATDIGAALCDGVGDLVSLGGAGSLARDVRLAYRILQGARLRASWTEFISCPSCGRTLFDLEETTARVKAVTAHLAGLKIAVMGCIVNGPGEMADADFGYVGSGVGRVDLYAGRERVLRNVAAEEAPARLVDLIRSHGRWVEPPSPSSPSPSAPPSPSPPTAPSSPSPSASPPPPTPHQR